YEEPQTEAEVQIAALWMQLLGAKKIGRKDNFFDLGGHSLLVMNLVSRIRERFAIEISLRSIFEYPTLQEMSALVYREEYNDKLSVRILPLSLDVALPLSFYQESLWFIQKLQNDSSYNIPMVLHLKGEIDEDRLRNAIDSVSRRQLALRSRIVATSGAPMQIVDLTTPLAFEVHEGVSLGQALDMAKRASSHVFDLENELSLRSSLYKINNAEAVLVILFHHINFDGWSTPIFARELSRFYNGASPEDINPLPLQYRDFAAWQHEADSMKSLNEGLDFWREELRDSPAVLTLPTDGYRRSEGYTGRDHGFELSEDLSQSVSQLAKKTGVTAFTVHLAAFAVLLHKYSRVDDLIIGVPTAVRDRQGLEDIIGYFVNSLPIRMNVTDVLSFNDLLQHVRTKFLSAIEHQVVPFDKIVENNHVSRIKGINPIFQVMFIYEDGQQSLIQDLDGLSCEVLYAQEIVAKFDLSLTVTLQDDRYKISFNYRDDLFKPQSIAQIADQYAELLSQITQRPQAEVVALSLLSKEQSASLIAIEKKKSVGYEATQNFVCSFEEQFLKYPERIAVRCDRDELSYEDLQHDANQLAHYLLERGVGKGAVVAILMDCSVDMMVAILGILKTGAAYLPLNYQAPWARNQGILSESETKVIITDCRAALEATNQLSFIDINEDRPLWKAASSESPAIAIDPHDLAYIIYTSGSTGKPKGVMIEHHS
ncbi:MAG: hypothetical protein EOP04_14420, partial [Proteobacteria bacterium]